ncbi:MAG: hypothetical protein IT473_09175 [Lysobacter sp.]|nr:hypothetical protein [Lysobacter sp.]
MIQTFPKRNQKQVPRCARDDNRVFVLCTGFRAAARSMMLPVIDRTAEIAAMSSTALFVGRALFLILPMSLVAHDTPCITSVRSAHNPRQDFGACA